MSRNLQDQKESLAMSNYFTRASHARLTSEVEKLRSQDLIALSRAKQAAAAEGDLSENAEYHATRERLEMVQRRIYELEEQLSSPRFIEELPISGDRPDRH
jgi:transcription elongation factor GreA